MDISFPGSNVGSSSGDTLRMEANAHEQNPISRRYKCASQATGSRKGAGGERPEIAHVGVRFSFITTMRASSGMSKLKLADDHLCKVYPFLAVDCPIRCSIRCQTEMFSLPSGLRRTSTTACTAYIHCILCNSCSTQSAGAVSAMRCSFWVRERCLTAYSARRASLLV